MTAWEHPSSRKRIFTGAATALITPFTENGSVDFSALEQLIERQIAGGADALVICGTTGECATLSEEEHRACLRCAVAQTAGRIPVIAGTGSCDTRKTISQSQYACAVGVDALLLVTPYYNKASAQGLTQHFLSVAEHTDKPIILYNVPSRTGVNIPLDVYRELALHERIVAVKEASGNMTQTARLIAALSDSLDIYSGCDEQTLPVLSLGGCGVISVVSNLCPQEMHLLCARFLQGDVSGARELHTLLSPLMEALCCDINPIPVKTACAMLGFCGATMRLPLCASDAATKNALQYALRQVGLSVSNAQ